MEVQAGGEAAASGGNPNPGAGGTGNHTPAAQASQSPQVTVNGSGTPGTSGGEKPAGADWTSSFDADTRDFVTQRGFKDAKTVVESFRNLEKLRGIPLDRLLEMPDPKANPETSDAKMKTIYERLGKPANPDGYGLAPKDDKNPEFTNWAKDAFHKLNLTKDQGQALVKQFNEFSERLEGDANAQHSAKVQEQVGVLRKEWGAAYNQNVARAQSAYRQFGIPDAAIDSLEKSIGFDGVIKMFHKLSTQVGEQEFINGGEGSGSFGDNIQLSPEQANARIKALKQDGDWAARYLKGDVKAKQEMERLMKMANPSD